jgi:hypothetical protein
VEDLGGALEEGDASARSMARSALEAVSGVGEAVKSLGAERPPRAGLSQIDAVGSALAIGGSGVATVALDVMVNAMVALAGTDDEDETDFLIGACVDAASAYEAGAAIVETVPSRDGPALLDLKRTFEAEGDAALRRRVTRARPRVLEINTRIGSDFWPDVDGEWRG